MALFNNGDKRYKYHYTITTFNILFGSDSVMIPPERINKIIITHDYINNALPIFQMNFVLDGSTYYRILQNKDTVKFNIRMQKFYNEIGESTKSLYRDVLNDTFQLIMDDDDYYADKMLLEKSMGNDFSNITKDTKNDLFYVDNEIELFFFKTNHIAASRTLANAILSCATTSDAIIYIASVSKFPPLLMAPTDNKKIYRELVIPPLGAMKAMSFIDSYYGLYKNGSIIYMDFDRCYIIPYSGNCSVYSTNEIKETCIIIPSNMSSNGIDSCTVVKKNNKNCNYIVATQFVNPRNDSNTEAVLFGNKVTSIDSSTGMTSATDGGNSIIDTESHILNRTENPFFNETYQAQSKMEEYVFDIYLSDYDENALRPNKKITLAFEDTSYAKKYRGTYMLTSMENVYVKNGSDLQLTTKITIKKSY